MKKSRIRSSLMGTTMLLTLSTLFGTMSGCGHDRTDTENYAPPNIATTTTTATTTTATTTATTTTTTITESTTTTTVAETTTTEVADTTLANSETTTVMVYDTTENVDTVESIETESTAIITDDINSDDTVDIDFSYPITDYERILLYNVVGNEYGSDDTPIYEKAKVVAVVFNRIKSPQFPNTIEDVLIQPYQFSGYYACNYEWDCVTPSVRAAVDYYFAHPTEFGEWLYFEGNGQYNVFH